MRAMDHSPVVFQLWIIHVAKCRTRLVYLLRSLANAVFISRLHAIVSKDVSLINRFPYRRRDSLAISWKGPVSPGAGNAAHPINNRPIVHNIPVSIVSWCSLAKVQEERSPRGSLTTEERERKAEPEPNLWPTYSSSVVHFRTQRLAAQMVFTNLDSPVGSSLMFSSKALCGRMPLGVGTGRLSHNSLDKTGQQQTAHCGPRFYMLKLAPL